jgi:hypothetical protein
VVGGYDKSSLDEGGPDVARLDAPGIDVASHRSNISSGLPSTTAA